MVILSSQPHAVNSIDGLRIIGGGTTENPRYDDTGTNNDPIMDVAKNAAKTLRT